MSSSLSIALPRRNEESFSRQEGRVSSRRQIVQEQGGCKIFVFVISQNSNFMFGKIFLEFCEIQNYFVKISQNYENKNFATTLCRSGVRGGACWYSPGASSTLTQIVPYSSSLYTVFFSVIYNFVVRTMGLNQSCGSGFRFSRIHMILPDPGPPSVAENIRKQEKSYFEVCYIL